MTGDPHGGSEEAWFGAGLEGAEIDSVYWTLGSFDGMFIISAPDEETAAGLVLKLGRSTAVKTCMLRAFTADEFLKVLSKAS